MALRWMASAGRPQGTRYLPANVRDQSEAFVLTAAIPGLKADDLKTTVLKDVVRIEGEFAPDENEYLLRELPGGALFRELRLPSPLKAEEVQARISDGILTIRLPKAEPARPKTIKVTGHKAGLYPSPTAGRRQAPHLAFNGAIKYPGGEVFALVSGRYNSAILYTGAKPCGPNPSSLPSC